MLLTLLIYLSLFLEVNGAIGCPSPSLEFGTWVHKQTIGKCYGAIPGALVSFGQGEIWCGRNGGHLAMPRNGAQIDAIASTALQIHGREILSKYLWIGIDDLERDGQFRFVDGQLVKRKDLVMQGPRSENARRWKWKYCIAMELGQNIMYNDLNCLERKHFLCETSNMNFVDNYNFRRQLCPPGGCNTRAQVPERNIRAQVPERNIRAQVPERNIRAVDTVKNPWFVRIYANNKYTCGGVLVGVRHVLTDGQCFKDFTGSFRQVPKSEVVFGLGSDSRDISAGLLFHPQSIKMYLDDACYARTKVFDWCRNSLTVVELRETLDLTSPNIEVARIADKSFFNYAIKYDKCIAPGFDKGYDLASGTLQYCEVDPTGGAIDSIWNTISITERLNKGLPCELSTTDIGGPFMCRNSNSGDGEWTVEGLFKGYYLSPFKSFNKVGRLSDWINDQLKITEDTVYYETVCYGETLNLFCDNGRIPALRIETAVYGRRSVKECLKLYVDEVRANTHCKRDVKTFISQTCDGKASCSTRVTSDVWGDPCPGLNKYLWVSYRCARLSQGSRHVKGSTVKLHVSLMQLLIGGIIAYAVAGV